MCEGVVRDVGCACVAQVVLVIVVACVCVCQTKGVSGVKIVGGGSCLLALLPCRAYRRSATSCLLKYLICDPILVQFLYNFAPLHHLRQNAIMPSIYCH